MSDLTIPRRQIVLCAFSESALRVKRSDGKTYRIDPHDALERMLNGHDTYELTTVTVRFTGEVDMSDEQLLMKFESRRKH